jgi:hypothetical protein
MTMTRFSAILFLTLITFTSCINRGDRGRELLLKDFKFNSVFGSSSLDKSSTYCLLGKGFFRTIHSDNSDSLIVEWVQKHPSAIVVPVSSFGPVMAKEPETKMVYCWIVDQRDTLNNYLIRKGCFPGGTMERPKTWNEMESWERELYSETDEEMDLTVFVDSIAYSDFLSQIRLAEVYAVEHKLGIWKDPH